MSGSLVIRATQTADHDAILSLLTAAFEQDDEARLVEKLWAAGGITLEFVAEQNNEIIGHCAFSEVTAKPALDGLLLGLAPLAVTPAHQRRGVGKALVEHGLNACRARDAALIVVLGEPAYYRRFGFEPASRFNITWAARDVGDAFQLIDHCGVADGASHRIDYHSAFSDF